jgi:hypothetical protein
MCGEDDEAPVTTTGLLGRQWDDIRKSVAVGTGASPR